MLTQIALEVTGNSKRDWVVELVSGSTNAVTLNFYRLQYLINDFY